MEEEETDKNKPVQQVMDEHVGQSSAKSQGCTHFLGYLSQRSSKEKIPEECMMCGKIVECMLKNVTG
jgi:hypothetical protein